MIPLIINQPRAYLFLLQERGDVTSVLSGWGVELAIKNSEYKAVDDSKVKGVSVLFLALGS